MASCVFSSETLAFALSKFASFVSYSPCEIALDCMSFFARLYSFFGITKDCLGLQELLFCRLDAILRVVELELPHCGIHRKKIGILCNLLSLDYIDFL